MIGRKEVLSTLTNVAQGGRLSYSWNVADDAARLDVRTALLAVMCIETALPHGGDIEITQTGNGWAVYARHEKLNLDPALWVPLNKGTPPETLSAAQVHFALLPTMAAEASRRLTLAHGSDWVRIAF